MSHWWCCCDTTCCYVEDTFCRDDTGDPAQGVLGGLWEVVSGTWYIDGGYCGDVGYDYECAECENNNPACTLRVTLGGIVVTDPEDCAECDDLNGEYDLTYQGNCLWRKTLGAAICGVTTIEATLSGSTLTVTAGDSTWTADVGASPSCIEFDKVALSPDVSATNCDNSSSACSVSAVVTSDLDCTGPETPFTVSHLGGDGAYKILKCTYEYPDCSNAENGNAAATITMVLNGIVSGDGSCADCDDLNNDEDSDGDGLVDNPYNLVYQGGGRWKYALGSTVCGVSEITLQLLKSGNDYVLVATAGDSTWIKNFGINKPSMVNFTDVVLTPSTSSESCNNSSSTCTISGGNFGVYFRVDGWAPPDHTWRAIVDYVDTNNYWIVEVKNGDFFDCEEIAWTPYSCKPKGAIRLIRRHGGVETVLAEKEYLPISGRDFTNDPSPGTIQLTLSGIVTGDGSCAYCDTLNGIYNLSCNGSCAWSTALPETICGVSTISLSASKVGNNYILTARAGDSTWTANLGPGVPSFTNFSGQSLAPNTSSDSCNNSSSTCSITTTDTESQNRLNRLYVCLEDDNLSAVISYQNLSGSAVTTSVAVPLDAPDDFPTLCPAATSRYVALGTGNATGSGSSRFRNFCLLKPTDDCTTCFSECLQTICKDYVFPDVIRASITVTGTNPQGTLKNCCSDLNGDYDLEYLQTCSFDYGGSIACYAQWVWVADPCSVDDCLDHCGINALQLSVRYLPRGYDSKSGWYGPFWRIHLALQQAVSECGDFRGPCGTFIDYYVIMNFAGVPYSSETRPDCNFSNYSLEPNPAFWTYCDGWSNGCEYTGGTCSLSAL